MGLPCRQGQDEWRYGLLTNGVVISEKIVVCCTFGQGVQIAGNAGLINTFHSKEKNYPAHGGLHRGKNVKRGERRNWSRCLKKKKKMLV